MAASVHIPYEIRGNRWFDYEQRWKEMCVSLLDDHIPVSERSSRTVLDFGCGRGELLKLLAEHGYRCEGADFDPTCVEISARYAPTRRLSDLDLENQQVEQRYDVVVALHVLEHLRDPAGAVSNLSKIANKFLVLGIPNLQSTALSCHRRPYVANEGHVVGWDWPHFKNFLTNICSLEVVEMRGDTVPLITGFSCLDTALEKLLKRRRIRALENGYLLRLFPHLSHSILAFCKVK